MNKEFIPYEQALALKELGFDEPCFGYRDGAGCLMIREIPHCVISAPTFSQAFRWFRRKYNLNAISPTRIYKTDFYYSRIVNWNNWDEIDVNQCDSYEEAELACLKKLIEIVKESQ